MEDVSIIIVCHKHDFFFTRICVASIRYFHPYIPIFILKDYLNGYFSSNELEDAFNVKVLDLGIKKYGWSAAKMHILLSKELTGKKFFTLDSDIVFAGRFLEKLVEESKGFDFTVHADFRDNPYTEWAYETYYNIDYLKSITPDFIFPGYFFNGGQMLITAGKLQQNEVLPFFDLKQFPYWSNTKELPYVDQSLLNYLLPYKEQKNEIKINKSKFMLWIKSPGIKNLTLESIKTGHENSFLIHYAGARRLPFLRKMLRPDILIFFENYYYERITMGAVKQYIRKFKPVSEYYLRKVYNKTFKRITKGSKLFNE